MKLCFSTLGCCDRDLESIIALARQYGISALEIRGIGGVMDNAAIEVFSETEREKTLALLSENGIKPVVLGTSCSFHNVERLEAVMAEGETCVRLAEAMGIKYIRVFGDRIAEKYGDSQSRVGEGIAQLCSLSDKVTVLLEVHGDFNTADALKPVLDRLEGIENFGLIWDIGHTHGTYGDRWREFYEFVRPYVRHVHVKDISDSRKCLTMIGEGDVLIKEITEGLIADGYDGYFSLEWEKKWHPELPEIEPALECFVKIMSQTELES